jgi:hypothetical protein
MNFGDFTTGYRIWELEAKPERCEEEVTLIRPDWWLEADKSHNFNLKVVRVACDHTCELGKRYESDISCACVDIEVEEKQGILYMAHDIAVSSTTRVMLDIRENDHVTLREWAVEGTFVYDI